MTIAQSTAPNIGSHQLRVEVSLVDYPLVAIASTTFTVDFIQSLSCEFGNTLSNEWVTDYVVPYEQPLVLTIPSPTDTYGIS